MSRPLRIEFAGALHHVSTRADRCEPVFEDVAERERSLRQLAEVAGAFDRQVRACCPMGNHFHLLVKPTDAERRARALRRLLADRLVLRETLHDRGARRSWRTPARCGWVNQADRSGRSTGTDSRADGVGPARRVVLASVLTTFALGSIHAFSVLGAAMERHFDAERARVSVVYSVALAMLTLLVLLSPRLYRLARAPLLLGVSFAGCALGVAICVPAASLLQVVLGYGVVFGAANGLGYGLALTMAATAMPGRKGLVMCVVTASYAVGAALGAKVLGVFTGTHGPAGGFLALLVLLLVSGVAAVALAVTGGARVEGEPVSRDAAPRHARTTLVLWLAYGTAVFSGLMAIGHAAGIAQAQGASTAQYATATMLIALGNALGGLACAPLADRLPVRGVLTLLPVCSLAGLLLMRVVPGVVPAMAGLAVVGFGYGATIAAYPPAVARIVGLGAYPRVYGRVFTAWGVAGLAAAWLAGRLYDITGSYAVSLDVAGGLALASVTTVLLAGRSLKRETAVGSC